MPLFSDPVATADVEAPDRPPPTPPLATPPCSPVLQWHYFLRLPVELQALIVAECDQASLCALSLVSLSVLELAGSHLYYHPTLKGIESIEAMFCSLIGVATSPAISPSLSLGQIKSLTIELGPSRGEDAEPSPGIVSFDRITSPLALDFLVLVLPAAPPYDLNDLTNIPLFRGHLGVWLGLSPLLFQHLSPVSFVLRCDPSAQCPPIFHSLEDISWPRLRRISLDHACAWINHLRPAIDGTSEGPVEIFYKINSAAEGLGLWVEYTWEDVQSGLLESPNVAAIVLQLDQGGRFKRRLEHIIGMWEDEDAAPWDWKAKVRFEIHGVSVPWTKEDDEEPLTEEDDDDDDDVDAQDHASG